MRKFVSKYVIPVFAAMTIIMTCDLAFANNLRVENAQFYKSSDQPAGTIDIKFDVIWDNPVSGTDGNSAAYFDRAWIFVKFWDTTAMGDSATGGGGVYPWGHAILTTGGSLSTYSQTTHTGITSDGIGAFVSPGTNQTVRWNYAASLIPGSAIYVASTDTVKVRVMAIEMVRVPTGAYELGDGATTESTNAFHVTDNTKVGTIGTTLVGSIKVDVNGYDDDQIEVTGIGIDGDGGLDTDNNGTIDNANFPTGYNAFYIMKYEVSQGQYRDFLNMLSRSAQNTRIASQAANQFTMSNTTTVTNRSAIRNPATIPSGSITFGCDLDADGAFNEADDGEWIAANYLSWMDLAAFSDWAGLRPMTELEYEKACRGGGVTDAATGYYAWGNATVETATSSLTDSGKISETPNQGNMNYSSCSPDGPYRCGGYADSATSTRQNAGASYYGVMEMSGSLWERPVTVGNTTLGTEIGGREFTGTHGDGALTTLTGYVGNATNSDWPGYNTAYSTRGISAARGSGFRGGTWSYDTTYARVSDRIYAANVVTNRSYIYGARCARTSP